MYSIEVQGVTKEFGRQPDAIRVLDDVSVEIAEREFFTLLGPSGCGKTTLLRLIAGFEDANAGEIRLSGAAIGHLPPYRRRVNTVFQSYALFPHLTVEQNVSFGLEMMDLPAPEIARRTAEALELVQMAHLARRRPAQLSGGQQQRVALARALAPRPAVLLLDEPLSALDLKLRKEMQIELKRVQSDAGITFVFVTHDQEEALTMSDRIAVMQGGRILQVGSPLEIYERPAHRFVADFIGEINFIPGTTVAGDDGRQHVMTASGDRVACHAADIRSGESVTLAIRPERAQLSAVGTSGTLPGTIEQVVYIGTATVYQIRLRGGDLFTLRQSNIDGGGQALAAGTAVAVSLPPAAVQVLKD